MKQPTDKKLPLRMKRLEALIPPPGHFLVLGPNKVVNKTVPLKEKAKGNTLDIFKQPEVARKVFAMYTRCHDNAVHLLHEARLLYQNGCYARAIALGIAAWEELGKSQIAADYHSGILHNKDYSNAFKNHKLKTSYLTRTGVIDGSGKLKIATIPKIGDDLERMRQDALYVSECNDPQKAFCKDDAEFVIKRVREHIEYIDYAERLNERIGSKALFK